MDLEYHLAKKNRISAIPRAKANPYPKLSTGTTFFPGLRRMAPTDDMTSPVIRGLTNKLYPMKSGGVFATHESVWMYEETQHPSQSPEQRVPYSDKGTAPVLDDFGNVRERGGDCPGSKVQNSRPINSRNASRRNSAIEASIRPRISSTSVV